MAESIVEHVLQNDRIQHEHAAGNGRHAAGHDDEKLAASERAQARPDQRRRLHHAHEDVGRGRQSNRTADAETAPQDIGKGAHQRGQDAQMPEHGGKSGNEQDAEGKNDGSVCVAQLERISDIGRVAAEIAENESGAGFNRRGNCLHELVDATQRRLHEFEAEYQPREQQLQA